jgi:short-subunit dehydrogenase
MDHIFSLKSKKIVVTGASSGIGKQIAITLSELGASIIAVGRNDERLKETFKLLKGDSNKIVFLDLTDENNIKSFVSELNMVDGVVFAAGIMEYIPVKFITAENISNILNIQSIKCALISFSIKIDS